MMYLSFSGNVFCKMFSRMVPIVPRLNSGSGGYGDDPLQIEVATCALLMPINPDDA